MRWRSRRKGTKRPARRGGAGEDPLRYEWRVDDLPGGSELPGNPFSINGSRNADRTEVLLDVPGVYVFALQVVDSSEALSDTSYVAVLAVPDSSLPVAEGGPDLAGLEGQEVCMDGNGPRWRFRISWTGTPALR